MKESSILRGAWGEVPHTFTFTMRTFSLARQWHREAVPVAWAAEVVVFARGCVDVGLVGPGGGVISALALSVADVALVGSQSIRVGWARAALEWPVWLVAVGGQIETDQIHCARGHSLCCRW